jgi:hypothetical protein
MQKPELLKNTLAQVVLAREKRRSAAVLSPEKVVTAVEMTF